MLAGFLVFMIFRVNFFWVHDFRIVYGFLGVRALIPQLQFLLLYLLTNSVLLFEVLSSSFLPSYINLMKLSFTKVTEHEEIRQPDVLRGKTNCSTNSLCSFVILQLPNPGKQSSPISSHPQNRIENECAIGSLLMSPWEVRSKRWLQ